MRVTADVSVAIALEAGADLIVGKRETAALMDYSVSTLDREVRRGRFPPPVQISERRIGWHLSVVKAHSASRPARTANAGCSKHKRIKDEASQAEPVAD